MHPAWLQLSEIFDFSEATHECAVCCHLSGPLSQGIPGAVAVCPSLTCLDISATLTSL